MAELLADVHRYANVFHSLGVRRADGVALLAPNCDELITATLAAELAGIAAPINSALSREHVAELLRRSGARVLVAAAPDLAPQVWESARELATEAGMDALLALSPTATGPGVLEPIDGVRVAHLSVLAAQQSHDRFLADPPTASDLAALFHTGGTTGTPKLAGHTHASEVTDAWMIALIGLMRERAVVFAALPLFHVNAIHVTLLAPLFRGLPDHLGWSTWATATQRSSRTSGGSSSATEVTTMSAVPTVYSALADRPVDADISSLRYAAVGASPLPHAVRDRFRVRHRHPAWSRATGSPRPPVRA